MVQPVKKANWRPFIVNCPNMMISGRMHRMKPRTSGREKVYTSTVSSAQYRPWAITMAGSLKRRDQPERARA